MGKPRFFKDSKKITHPISNRLPKYKSLNKISLRSRNYHKTAPKKKKDDDQANSFACKKCHVYYSEESGAYPGFVCENCDEED